MRRLPESWRWLRHIAQSRCDFASGIGGPERVRFWRVRIRVEEKRNREKPSSLTKSTRKRVSEALKRHQQALSIEYRDLGKSTSPTSALIEELSSLLRTLSNSTSDLATNVYRNSLNRSDALFEKSLADFAACVYEYREAMKPRERSIPTMSPLDLPPKNIAEEILPDPDDKLECQSFSFLLKETLESAAMYDLKSTEEIKGLFTCAEQGESLGSTALPRVETNEQVVALFSDFQAAVDYALILDVAPLPLGAEAELVQNRPWYNVCRLSGLSVRTSIEPVYAPTANRQNQTCRPLRRLPHYVGYREHWTHSFWSIILGAGRLSRKILGISTLLLFFSFAMSKPIDFFANTHIFDSFYSTLLAIDGGYRITVGLFMVVYGIHVIIHTFKFKKKLQEWGIYYGTPILDRLERIVKIPLVRKHLLWRIMSED